MSRAGRLRDLAQPVARQLRDKLLILLELRDKRQIAHACARTRGLMVFLFCECFSMIYAQLKQDQQLTAQPVRNRRATESSFAQPRKGWVVR